MEQRHLLRLPVRPAIRLRVSVFCFPFSGILPGLGFRVSNVGFLEGIEFHFLGVLNFRVLPVPRQGADGDNALLEEALGHEGQLLLQHRLAVRLC